MKSHVSDLTELATCIYKDAVAKCAATWQDMRDVNTMSSRAKHEGLSFFTITLPDFGKDLEKALAAGQIGPPHFRGFRKYGKIPAFLRGIFALVFDKATGRLYDEPDISAIEALRQISFSFKKIGLACSETRVRRAIQSFIECEQDLNGPIAPLDANTFLLVSNHVWDTVLASIDVLSSTVIPKHGPGATAERVSGNAKYTASRWHERLEPYFPLYHNRFPSESAYGSVEAEQVSLISEADEQPVRVITVPKTLKSPRIIAIEPVCMQYAQQAISGALVRALESSELTRGHLNFRDQKVNQKMAITSSKSMRYATLDLSSASDRVPNSLACRMFDSNPDLQGAIQACRSRKAQIPDGRVISLLKFASMGSALCFPVEAMYFYTICIAALLRKRRLPVTRHNCYVVSRDVYIYGDDIIVPADDAAAVVDHLHKYYCKVNTSKSFWTGKFRESCGVDAYDGEVVTPTYIRHMHPYNRREASAIIGWVKSANLFYKRGYWLTSAYLFKQVEAIIGALPMVGPDCAGLGKVSFQHLVSAERWNKRFQVFEVKTWCAVPVYRKDRLEGYGALTKSLLRLERSRFEATPIRPDHLSRTERHSAVALKRCWTRPY